ncbi:hypothetical protein AVEN_227570-1 [Araneus ventricosus]|uniref:Uncharacterized protein n=1 Tax=Araneus ventricosus TaxID=182803 RepID=A0A4Y2C4R3_ARAVE|nr:hypothetical protein AVEN_227570-1 [Araneus ventricosus]
MYFFKCIRLLLFYVGQAVFWIYTTVTRRRSIHREYLLLRLLEPHDFAKKFKKHDEVRRKYFYCQILNDMMTAVINSDLINLKWLACIIQCVNDELNNLDFQTFFRNADNSLKDTNLIILSCKYNSVQALDFIFDHGCTIIDNLSTKFGNTTWLPTDVDENQHNAFYYAIRSTNVNLLSILISKWPDNYFDSHKEELDEILSSANSELKLKNVPIDKSMELFVRDKLINLRFFSSPPNFQKNVKIRLDWIGKRAELVIKNIDLLKNYLFNNQNVNEKFLLIAKYITKDIHILKRQLKCTYDKLPWEEIEFCLATFISISRRYCKMNPLYIYVLKKRRLLRQLQYFSIVLQKEMSLISTNPNRYNLVSFPRLSREEIIEIITKSEPIFQELHNDFKEIRDYYSLEIINNSVNLALAVNPDETLNASLVITRSLLVIGEHLKNTLESPNLSDEASEHLLVSLSRNTREILAQARNYLSHEDSLIERKRDVT